MSSTPTQSFLSNLSPNTFIKNEIDSSDVWSIFSPASGEFPGDVINFGQGYMNWMPPPYVIEESQKALNNLNSTHYSNPKGSLRLRQALSDWYSPIFFPNSNPNPDSNSNSHPSQHLSSPKTKSRILNSNQEILVTTGADLPLHCAARAFLKDFNWEEEIVVFEPFFDEYPYIAEFNNAKTIYVPIRPPPSDGSGNVKVTAGEWKIDMKELRDKIRKGRTKMIIFNTPHNPLGKVFTLEELREIGNLAREFDLLILADEVYEQITLNNHIHHHIAQIDGNAFWDRTISIFSAGKSFSCTGYRLGWVIAPPHLLEPLLVAHTRYVFSSVNTFQDGIARGFEKEIEVRDGTGKEKEDHGEEKRNSDGTGDEEGNRAENVYLKAGYFPNQRISYTERWKVVQKGLENAGFDYLEPQGAYFVMVDIGSLVTVIGSLEDESGVEFPKVLDSFGKDFKTCWYIAQKVGVIMLPATAFYSKQNRPLGQNYARLSFAKDTQTLKEGCERLKRLGMKARCE